MATTPQPITININIVMHIDQDNDDPTSNPNNSRIQTEVTGDREPEIPESEYSFEAHNHTRNLTRPTRAALRMPSRGAACK
jgi:hypothetical protein